MQHAYEREMEVCETDYAFLGFGFADTPWAEFVLNPRRLRGSDFLMRWSQGVWSEQRMLHALNTQGNFYCIPYGPSSAAPKEPRKHEIYFEKLEAAGLGHIKRPDLMVFNAQSREEVDQLLQGYGGIEQLPFINETELDKLLDLAILGIECENSLWKAKMMPDYGSQFRPMKRLNNQLGLPKNAKLPTIIIKDEDIASTRQWQETNKIDIHVWHSFYDLAFGIAWHAFEDLIEEGKILPTQQTYQAPSGPTTEKDIYKVYYQYAYKVGVTTNEPSLVASSITDKNGHILPYVRFDGGTLDLDQEALLQLGAQKPRTS